MKVEGIERQDQLIREFHLDQTRSRMHRMADLNSRFKDLNRGANFSSGVRVGAVLFLAALVLGYHARGADITLPASADRGTSASPVAGSYDPMLIEAEEIRQYIISRGEVEADKVQVVPVFAPFGSGEVRVSGLAKRDFPKEGDPTNQLTYEYASFPGYGIVKWPYEATVENRVWGVKGKEGIVPADNNLAGRWIFQAIEDATVINGEREVFIQRRTPGTSLAQLIP